jgi:hypothetical protein
MMKKVLFETAAKDLGILIRSAIVCTGRLTLERVSVQAGSRQRYYTASLLWSN